MCIRDSNFKTNIAIDYIHPTKGTYWVLYKFEINFNFCGCHPPKKNKSNVSSYETEKMFSSK